MKALHSIFLAAAALAAASGNATDAGRPGVAELYARHCAVCHSGDRLGGMGPALLPDNLARLRKPEALKIVAEGRTATQMLGFGEQLSKDEIAALIDWIYSPVDPPPRWTDDDIRASRIQHVDSATLSDKPVFDADPLNVFLVVEGGDHHVSVLDGDRLEPIHRFQSRFALHGGPKFAAGGRYVFFGSRDGWITKYDLWNLTVVAEVRAGINTRNVAASPDGKHVAVANYLPNTLVLLDGDLNLVKTIAATDRDGKHSSRVSAVYDATPRQSFIAALKDVPEVWEISYTKAVEDIPTGFIHDYAQKEGSFIPGYLNPRRTVLGEVLDDFFFTQDYAELMGASREGVGQVVNLDIRRKIADLPLDGMPHLGSGITWEWIDASGAARTVMASTNLKAGEVTVIDMKSWEVVKRIATRGPGFFLRSHANSRYAFVDSMMSPQAKHILQVIDKQTLEVVKEITGEPGKTLAHVEFTRDGRYALASLWEDEGAVIVYDAQTLEEVKRLPMRKPVGKYNVWNKISREEGTSH
ncbi:cytochrome D1 domain-containing protein [Thauera linaloolentis]|uniref:Cytochrome d1 heme region n=1 Tax=Thauera linaloolentis (strain DSM 12138 / JCM 21573 / CCUG 41526 / CIP 105981 / IAM 15112 / NBRC 102519 / 47Lol) TaxID=1123367 RepID=N6YEL6_THAL4|nr:cytochrome D1 domain-containing protein [Thauera linaloolentis]ENO89955.1 cytochrome d1 heme region [Thauera linaloolentis 47Lol = DSM 12138]MCM8566618.1 nitrite reductase [Thauera linaloolentis]